MHPREACAVRAHHARMRTLMRTPRARMQCGVQTHAPTKYARAPKDLLVRAGRTQSRSDCVRPARKNKTILSKNIFILPTRPLELRLFTALVWALGLPPAPPASGWNREIERRADFQLPPRFSYHPA